MIESLCPRRGTHWLFLTSQEQGWELRVIRKHKFMKIVTPQRETLAQLEEKSSSTDAPCWELNGRKRAPVAAVNAFHVGEAQRLSPGCCEGPWSYLSSIIKTSRQAWPIVWSWSLSLGLHGQSTKSKHSLDSSPRPGRQQRVLADSGTQSCYWSKTWVLSPSCSKASGTWHLLIVVKGSGAFIVRSPGS